MALKRQKIACIFGTRPEAIKMAPVVRQLRRREDRFETVTVVTGQHRELLDQVLEVFDLTADFDLQIMTPSQTLTEVTVRCLQRLEDLLPRLDLDLVLVHGDTATTLATAWAAFYQQIPVGHVEAGLRTFDRYQPFPEEMNRVLTDHISSLHFAPTALNLQHLQREGIPEERIFVTGNSAIDALLMVTDDDYRFCHPDLSGQPWGDRRLILCDLHRRENFGKPLREVLGGLAGLMDSRSDAFLVVSVHPNPQVAQPVERLLGGRDRIQLIKPLDYREWANLMSRSHFLITDSGGLQEEAPALGVPVLLAREKTERPEAVRAGTVRKVGTDGDVLVEVATRLLDDGEYHGAMAGAPNPYGDGRAAVRIADAIWWQWGQAAEPPEEFSPSVSPRVYDGERDFPDAVTDADKRARRSDRG